MWKTMKILMKCQNVQLKGNAVYWNNKNQQTNISKMSERGGETSAKCASGMMIRNRNDKKEPAYISNKFKMI